MTGPFRENAELGELLDALCEETITPEQMRRLEEIVLGDPEAEALYVQYMSLHADLASSLVGLPRLTEQTLGARTSPPAAPAGPARRPARRLLPWAALGLVGVAAGLLIALGMDKGQPGKPPPPDGQSGERIDDTVAVLVRAPDAVWGATELPTRPGSALPSGWLRLKSGFAHLEFYSGATVVLQGPAELRLISRMEAYCASGKLRAVVPPHAQGFTIGSPKLDLIDRGTEFGMQVDGGKTEVHVFDGLVELYDPGRAHRARPRHELRVGGGMAVDGPGVARPVAPNPAAFPTARFLTQRSQAAMKKRYQEWLMASAAWRKDRALMAYYDFEQADAESRALLDQSRGREKPRDGTIVGCSWVAGRWPATQALQFNAVTDRVRVNIPGGFDSLTLTAWVRVDGLPNQNNALLMADGWEPGEIHWQIGEEGKLVLGVQGDPKGRGSHYHAHDAITPDRFGRWLHLAVVYDREAGHVTHYVDGEALAQQPIEFDIKLRIGEAEIGNWNLASHRNRTPVRFFSGRIDELKVIAEALDDARIQELARQGRPPD